MAATSPRRDGNREGMPDEFSSRHLLRRLIGLGIVIGVIAALVVSLPGLGTLRDRFGDADWRLLILIGLFKLLSCLSNIVAFRDVFSRRMSWRFSYRLGMAEQATNVLLPTGGAGGLALGAWALHQGGMSTEHIARRSVAFFVLTSLPNFAVTMILGPLLLIGALSGNDPSVPTIVFSALAWAATVLVAALPFVLRRLDRRQGRLAGRLHLVLVSLGGGIRDCGVLLRERRWRAILGALGYLGFDMASLVIAFAAFGSHLPLGPLLFGYVIGQLGGLIPLPGGIGGTDGGLIGAIVLYGSPLSTATAGVLAYRAFQVAVPAVLGAIAFIGLRHTLSGTHTPQVECAGLEETGAHPAVDADAADGADPSADGADPSADADADADGADPDAVGADDAAPFGAPSGE